MDRLKTVSILFILLSILIGMIVFLLYKDNGTNKALTEMTERDSGATSQQIKSFDQAVLYTCTGGSVIATAFATLDTNIMELSLPEASPAVLQKMTADLGVQYEDTSGLIFSEKNMVAQVKKDGSILFDGCVVGSVEIAEEISAPSPIFSFADTSWLWRTTNSFDGTVLQTPALTGEMKLNLQSDKTFTLVGDCYSVAGEYKISYDTNLISFTIENTTAKKCLTETEGLAFLKFFGLVKSFGFAMTESDLEFVLEDGATYLQFNQIDL